MHKQRQSSLCMDNVSKEFNLLIDIVNGKQLNIESLEIDWTLFFELTLHHRLYSYIYPRISLNQEYIPDHIIDSLERLYKQNTFNMLHLSGEMNIIGKLFSENRIPLLMLKGPVLAKELYGDISLRTSSDLDVMVPLQSLEEAEALLKEQGYVKDDYIKTVLNDWKWRHHHVTYFHHKKGIKVEVHWRLNPGPGKEPTFNELWERRSVSNFTGNPLYMLGREDLFFFLISHGARHAWSRLRWLLDINQLLKMELDWKLVRHLIKTNHFLPISAQTLQLTLTLFKSVMPDHLVNLSGKSRGINLAQKTVFYFENMVNLHTDPVPVYIARYHSHYILSIMSWQQKIYYLLSLFYPFPEDAETLTLPKRLHFLYFPLRPFLWLKRKLKQPSISS